MTLSGCALLEGEAAPVASPSSSPVVSPSPRPSTPVLSPDSVAAKWIESEELLGEISSMRGTDEIGPVSSEAGRVVIYVRCFGSGTLIVEVVGSATFDQQCLTDPEDAGTRNQIQVLAPDDVVVRGAADSSNVWAIAVTDGDESMH